MAILTIRAENGVDRSLGCRSECEAGRVRHDARWTENYCWDSGPLETGLGVVECQGSRDPEKSLTEGPHAQIAKDPERRWTQDL